MAVPSGQPPIRVWQQVLEQFWQEPVAKSLKIP